MSSQILISQSKKEMENFVGTNLRIITQEKILQKILKTVPPGTGQGTVMQVFEAKDYTSDDILPVYTVQISMSEVIMGHHDPLPS